MAMPRVAQTWTGPVFLCIFIVFLLGGFNLEGNVINEPDLHAQSEMTEQWLLQVEEEKRAIEELPFVRCVSFTYGETANANKVLATVSCCWEMSRQSFKQIPMACHQEERPTPLEALRALREKLIREHGGNDHVHHPKAVARRAELEQETQPASNANAFDRMKAAAALQSMAAQRAEADARALEKAHSAEVEATHAREVAEARAAESAAKAKALAPRRASKKQKTASASASTSTTAAEADTDKPDSWSTWAVSMWRKEERWIQKRRSRRIDPDSTDTSLPPRGGEERGWRNHWRRGLIGTVQDWADGSKFRAAYMIAELAKHFDVVDAVAEHLGLKSSKEEVTQAKTDAHIVDRISAALGQLKQCRSVAENTDYGVVLAAAAPERAKQGDTSGMMAKVFARLGVQGGSRYVKATAESRPRAPDQAVTRRAAFDQHSRKGINRAVAVGDAATSFGRACTVLAIDHEEDTCTLSFKVGTVELTRSFSCIYKGKDAPGKAPFPKGSARLRPVPPSLRPEPRAVRKDEKAEAARPKVEELFNAEGARSPAQRDQVRRRLGVGLYEKAQALYIYAKLSSLYALFLAQFPAYKISFSVFKSLRPWYMRRAKQETCLCKHCENFKGYMEVLNSLVKLFESTVSPASADADDAADNDDDETELDSWEGRAGLLRLMEFCGLKSKSEMVKFSLCSGAFDDAGKLDCINCNCPHCGFSKLWSAGLRKHVVDARGNLRESAPIEFQSEVKWLRIRSSKKTEPGEAKQPSYETNSGTVVEFLDAFERDVMKKYPHHRFTIQRQKQTAREFERNRCPGWVQSDVDFAMDGEILPPRGRSAQQEHWSPMGYTAFIQVLSWLVTQVWVSRSSELATGDAVTVEPPELSQAGATQPAEGSFWAEVVVLPNVSSATELEPERRKYGVRRHGAAEAAVEWVERQYLRHRKLHTKAFIHISNDKTHDSAAAQTFMNKTFKYLEENVIGDEPGKETFFAWHMHSDNAPSHFKSSQTMNYATTLPDRLKAWAARLPISFRVFWEFGAPGHGKGVWDGIGAWMKRTVREDIIDDRPPDRKTIKTASGNILTPEEVAEHLKASFNTDEYVRSHMHKTINEVVVIYTPIAEIKRVTTNKYSAMPGMKKTFLFMAVREGVTLQRKFACWCDGCMRASAPGEGSMDSNYECVECPSSQELPWLETVVEREDAAGVANGRKRTRVHAKDLRDQLQKHFLSSNQPVWVGVQNRGEDDPDQYWIGRALRIVKTHEENGTVGRVRFDAGDVEIAVEWYERDISGGDERRVFRRWEADLEAGNGGPVEDTVYTFNSTELRMINVEMVPVAPVGGVPLAEVRRSSRVAQRAREIIRNVVSRMQPVKPPSPLQLFEITEGSEGLILHWCCR